jgi:hypothetical protein
MFSALKQCDEITIVVVVQEQGRGLTSRYGRAESCGGLPDTRQLEGRATPMTIQITRPEVEALINQRLQSGAFKDAEDVILQALKSSETETQGSDENRREAINRLMAFGKKHGLSLDGMTIRELRDEARP